MFEDIDDFDWDEESDSDNGEDSESDIEKLEEIEDELIDKKDELTDREDEIHDKAEDIREHIEDAREEVEEGSSEAEEQLEDISEELEGMSEMRRELEDIRRMKEELRKEIEGVRREKEDRVRRGRRLHGQPKPPRPPRPVKPPRAPRAPRRAAIIDFSSLTDDLEDMMDGLGEQIEAGLKSVGDIRIPHLRLATKGKRRRVKRKKSKEYEKIPPERIAHVIGPLGSEERLKLLNFLKEGGKTFNELETYTGKTGSSLTHHLSPLVEAGYVIKGEVRGTYYVSVEGRLAYRLAQWLTSRLEEERILTDVKAKKLDEHAKNDTDLKNGKVTITIDDDEDDI